MSEPRRTSKLGPSKRVVPPRSRQTSIGAILERYASTPPVTSRLTTRETPLARSWHISTRVRMANAKCSTLQNPYPLQHAALSAILAAHCTSLGTGRTMIISSSVEAGTLIGSLREMRGLSRRELSTASGVPLRTVYAAENGELRNMSIDRVISLLSALGANLNVEVEAADAGEVRDDETNVLVNKAARGAYDPADSWGIGL